MDSLKYDLLSFVFFFFMIYISLIDQKILRELLLYIQTTLTFKNLFVTIGFWFFIFPNPF